MTQEFPAAASPKARFDWICNNFSAPLHKHCELKVMQQRAFLDSALDADDLYIRVLEKIFLAYFAPNAKNTFKYQGNAAVLALLKRTADNLLKDLVKQYQRQIRHVRLLELDAPIRSDSNSGETLAMFVSSESNTALEIEAALRISAAIAAYCQRARSPGVLMVARYLLGELSREDLAEYDDNYIKVVASRMEASVREYLAMK